MIAPNLFQGGTDDLDVIHLAQTNNRPRTDLPFDAIVTMYAWARPADWNIQEFRYGVPDAAITDIDLNRLRQAVEFGHERWKARRSRFNSLPSWPQPFRISPCTNPDQRWSKR
jgi:hypothetical protein